VAPRHRSFDCGRGDLRFNLDWDTISADRKAFEDGSYLRWSNRKGCQMKHLKWHWRPRQLGTKRYSMMLFGDRASRTQGSSKVLGLHARVVTRETLSQPYLIPVASAAPRR